ncbi:DUF4932 domain-containing protein [Sedimentibacter sp. zth1]|uniref:DUF4932 domain-containing protein n=1 Tax=Sedimentibacter sp. zth1 TaxID=2816908 RepID=UPI001A9286BB|nr:DUF4932 domain-containing protein [Sedimentibacter sp. zth1]QSX05924.1 DUF4932 domain-containing protein [Sedimentibacter sp. zth1]
MIKNKSICYTKNAINVCVDYRIELLSIVEYLAGYDTILTKLNFSYKERVKKYFSPYKQHEVTKLFLELNKIGFTFGTPPNITLYLDEDFQIREDIDFDNFYINRMGGKENFERFSNLLYKFSIDTNYDEFFKNNIHYYESVIENTINILPDYNFINELHNYYGMKKNNYNILLVSLFGPCGFGPKVVHKNGDIDIYSIVGLLECNPTPSFGNVEYFKHMQRHEFSHSFINPLTLKHWDEAKEYIELFDKTKEIKQLCYGDWEECLNEHIIRAVVIRLSSLDEEGIEDKLVQEELSRGFIYIEDIIKSLKYYEQNRHIYKNIDEYYMKILEDLNKN